MLSLRINQSNKNNQNSTPPYSRKYPKTRKLYLKIIIMKKQEKIYRLEFDKKEQTLSLKDKQSIIKHIVISDNCTLIQKRILEAYLGINPQKKYTPKYIIKQLNEIHEFQANLMDDGLTINYIKNKKIILENQTYDETDN